MPNHSGLAKLDKQLQALNDDLKDLGATDMLKQMRLQIRRPGWTTPAELALVTAGIASMRSQAQGLARQLESLSRASDMVGE